MQLKLKNDPDKKVFVEQIEPENGREYMKTIFMGTPDFAAVSLEALIKAGHDVVCVVSQPDAAKDRGKKIKYPPVKEKALEYGVTVLQPEKIRDKEFMDEISGIKPDIIVVAAYGKILPKEILELPRYGCVNVHASLLPKYRGSAPIQHSILSGEEVTGVTIMQMAEGMDTGDMISKVEVGIDHKNCEQLHDELASAGAELLVQTLKEIESGTAVPEKQNDDEATYAPMIKKKDGLIDFSASAVSIERKIRAFYPWPGSFTKLKGEMFKIWKASVEEDDKEKSACHVPGTVISADPEGIRVCTGDGILRLTEIQTPGKRRMDTEDWLKGNSIEIHTVLG